MKPKHLLVYLFSGLAAVLNAQSVFTIEEAIKTGLEKNYDVLVVKNQQSVTKLQNNAGNAGLSPTVSLNANLNASSLDSHLEFNTGAIQDRSGAKSSNLGASLNASWTVFDGLKMFAIKKRLDLNEQGSAILLKQQMEEGVYAIITTYYNIVKLNQLQKAANQNLALYEERKKIATFKEQVGSGSQVDVLLTQSLYNKAQSDLWQLQMQVIQAKANLNQLLGLPADNQFSVSDSMPVNYAPALDDLRKSSVNANSSLLLSQQNERILQQSVEEARAGNLPYLQVNGAYNFTRNSSQAGIIFLNRQNGLSGGLTAGWLLFNGNKNNRLIKERSILVMNQNLISQQVQQKVDGQVYVSYQSFLLQKKILSLEYQNLKDATELLNVSLERYKTGKAILLETMEAQKQLEEAQSRYISALYALKVGEADLLKASGNLLK